MSIQPLNNSPLPIPVAPAAPRPAADNQVKQANAGAAQQAQNRSPSPPPDQAAKPTEQKEAVHQATKKANQAIEGLRSDLKFTVDDNTGTNVVKIVDVKTKETIRQIPAQEMLEIAKRLDELTGLLVKERA